MAFFNFGKNSVLYFPGCSTYFKNKDKFELYKEIFSKIGIDFYILDNKVCCGLPALEAGYENDARKLARRNFEIFKEKGVKTIITNSACCYKMFLQNYNEFIPDWNIEVKEIWQMVFDRLSEKPKLIKNNSNEAVAYQDSCYLGRHCGIYSAPRQILDLIGYEIKEFPDTKENAFCCGSCGNLPVTNPELADSIAKERILQTKRIGIKKIITSSMKDYELMKKNTVKEVKIVEMSEVIAEALGIKEREEAEDEEKIEDLKEKIEDRSLDDENKIIKKNIDYEEEVERIIADALKEPKEKMIEKISKDFEGAGK